LSNKKRREIMKIEDDAGLNVQVTGSDSLFPEHLEIDLRDEEGREIKMPGA
jgi:ribonuclease E